MVVTARSARAEFVVTTVIAGDDYSKLYVEEFAAMYNRLL